MRTSLTTLLILLLGAGLAPAQRGLEHDRSIVSQVRIDLRDLGYPPLDVIPPDESAIRALTVAPNGALYGATSGKRSHLFVLYPAHGWVQPLGHLQNVTTVHRALVVSASGEVYVGGSIGVDNNGEGYAGYAGGHLLKYTPGRDEGKPIRIDQACATTDLGIPVPGEGIYALAINRPFGYIHGLSYPSGQFFHYDIRAGKFTVHGTVAERRIPGEKFENEKLIGRAIALDAQGHAYTSGESGFLYRFNGQRLERLPITVPTVRGREPYNRVDAWAEHGGLLYGASSDGYLFRLDPQKLKLDNLGKPLNQYRIRGLVFGRNGKLYGVGGDDDEMARLFSYDPASGVYEMLGMIDVNRRPYYSWHAYLIDAVALGADGTVYLGQCERGSRLYLYHPE